MSGLGFARESRIYQPHVILARVSTRGVVDTERQPEIGERPFAMFSVDRFVLMQTLPWNGRRKEGGSRYTIVQMFPFGNTSSSSPFGA